MSLNSFKRLVLASTIFLGCFIVPDLTAWGASGLAPTPGNCSALYGPGHDFGVTTDNSVSGLYTSTDSCLPIKLTVTDAVISPNKFLSAGKTSTMNFHLVLNSNTSSLELSLEALYLHNQTDNMLQENVHSGLCNIAVKNPIQQFSGFDSAGNGTWDLVALLPATCPAGKYHLMFDFQYDEPSANNVTETFMELANFPSNSLTIVAGSPVASKVPTLQSKPTSSAVAPSNSPGQTCLTTGATGSTASGRIVCRLVNKHKIWSFITTQPPFAKKQSNSVSTTTATALGKTYGQMLAQLDVPIIYFKGLNILNLRNIWAKELCSAGESGGGAPSQLVDPHLGGLYHYPKGNADPNFKAFNNACIEDLGWPAAW